jgi:anti-sigma regulatory factor (Ser/Thr protein kinase)
MTEWLEMKLPASPGAAAEAREFLWSALETWALDGLGEVTELLASELVTNAVTHVGEQPIVLRVRAGSDRIRVEVDDPGGGEPFIRHVDETTTHGRGLLIVESLATAWGTRHHPDDGKSVWFEVDVETADAEMHPPDHKRDDR